VPVELAEEEILAAALMLSVAPLLERVRASCDGPLVLMKGPAVAVHYPGSARSFWDLDLLVPNPECRARRC